MTRRFDCSDPTERADGLLRAAEAVRRGELVVMPTDTVYGLGCDAFTPNVVDALLACKGRGRDMPVPVLVGSTKTLSGLTGWVSPDAERLIEAFWPGPLTVVVTEAPSLAWDLGDAAGTVAVRMPLHPVALELLTAVGPMAVSSANRSGLPPASSGDEVVEQLGDAVSVLLDGGPSDALVPSTIVDVTGSFVRVLRVGALSLAELREVVPDLVVPE